MRLLSVLLTACSAVLLLAACGSSRQAAPRIDRATAKHLAAESDAIANASDPCGAARLADQLQADVETAIADGRVPVSFQGELTRNAMALVDQLNCPAPPPREKDHGKKEHKKKKEHD